MHRVSYCQWLLFSCLSKVSIRQQDGGAVICKRGYTEKRSVFNEDRNTRQHCVCVCLKSHTHFGTEKVATLRCIFSLFGLSFLWDQHQWGSWPLNTPQVYVFVQSWPEIVYNVSVPSSRVASRGRPLWLLEHSEELGNETLQSSTLGLAATLTSASVWRTKERRAIRKKLVGFFLSFKGIRPALFLLLLSFNL